MQNYALLFRNGRGVVVQRFAFAAPDDQEAQRVAEGEAKGRNVELWSETRRIAAWSEDEQAERLEAIRHRFDEALPVPEGAAVIATTPAGTVAYWDRNAAALYGWRAAEAVGRDIVELTPAIQSRATAADIMASLQAGRGWAGEIVLRRRNGEPFRAFVLDVPVGRLSSRDGAIVGVSLPIEEADAIRARQIELEHAITRRFGGEFQA